MKVDLQQIQWLVTGYEPFLKKGNKYTVIGHEGNNPVVIDNTGVKVQLNRKKHYKLIK